MKIVHETQDYGVFKKLPGQRDVKKHHVEEIISSIQNYGWICDPIRVTERMEIFDGQHRLEALRALGMPVEYIVLEGLTTADAVRIINNTQTKWTLRDYTNSYSDTGNESYALIRELSSKYSVSEKVVLRAANRVQPSGGATDIYKNGNYTFTESDYSTADNKLPVYKDYSALFRRHKGPTTVKDAAIFFLIDNGYEYQDIATAENNNGDKSFRFDSTYAALQYIENICNYKKQKQNRIYPSDEYKKTGAYTRGYK